MKKQTPAQHAALGWSHGQYKDGICLAIMAHSNADDLAEFRAEAKSRGAEYVDLRSLPEFKP